MIHKLFEPTQKWALAIDIRLTGCETTTQQGWTERHIIAITYSNKEHMRSFYVTLFFVAFGIGWVRKHKPPY